MTEDREALQRYEGLLQVPESITRSMTEFTQDGAPIELRRHQIAKAIEELSVGGAAAIEAQREGR